MVVIELTYKKPLSEADRYLSEHRNFLQKYYDEHIFLLSGVKKPRDGGIIIANTDKAQALTIIKADPFYQFEIADYTVTEFIPSRTCDELMKFRITP
ncbi:MAG: GTP cyclohydrolase [Legionellales bacterium]|nr:GTP cyclohydrolase [Legionellales bacterium]